MSPFDRLRLALHLAHEQPHRTAEASDVALATLPPTAAKGTFQMRRREGRDQVAAALHQGTWRSFEAPFPTYYYACARRWPGLIIDVGANTGFYTLLGASASAENVLVAFEPDAAIMAATQENVALSGLGGQVAYCTSALSSEPGRAILYVPTQEHGLIETSSSLEANFKSAHSEAREVEVDTLDRFLSQVPYAGTPVTLLKVDVEGHECPVLAGARDTIRVWRPILFAEVLGQADFGALTELVRSNDYVDLPLRPSGTTVNYGEVQFFADGWNHAFVPREKFSDFSALDL